MLKPVDPAAIAPRNLPGWSVSPAYPAVAKAAATLASEISSAVGGFFGLGTNSLT